MSVLVRWVSTTLSIVLLRVPTPPISTHDCRPSAKLPTKRGSVVQTNLALRRLLLGSSASAPSGWGDSPAQQQGHTKPAMKLAVLLAAALLQQQLVNSHSKGDVQSLNAEHRTRRLASGDVSGDGAGKVIEQEQTVTVTSEIAAILKDATDPQHDRVLAQFRQELASSLGVNVGDLGVLNITDILGQSDPAPSQETEPKAEPATERANVVSVAPVSNPAGSGTETAPPAVPGGAKHRGWTQQLGNLPVLLSVGGACLTLAAAMAVANTRQGPWNSRIEVDEDTMRGLRDKFIVPVAEAPDSNV
eukprot:SAG22_NODE_1329_length_4710_cov_1.942095_2_plen_303_part_00